MSSKLKYFFNRYFVQAMNGMALGLFSSLIVGLILSQLGKIPYLGFLTQISNTVSASSPVVGAAIGAAIAWGLNAKPLVIFSSTITGAIGLSLIHILHGTLPLDYAGHIHAGKSPVLIDPYYRYALSNAHLHCAVKQRAPLRA